MARKATTRKRRPGVVTPGLALRCFLYLAAALPTVAQRGPSSLAPALGLSIALVFLAWFELAAGEDEDAPTTRPKVFAFVQAVLLGFLVWFGGVGRGVMLVPIAVCALISTERGSSVAAIFAVANAISWLGPTLADPGHGNLPWLEIVFRLAVLAAASQFSAARPTVRSEEVTDDAVLLRDQGRALQKAQQMARSESEARQAREQELFAERRKLEGLLEIAHRMAVLRQPDELLRTVVDTAREQLQSDVAVVLLRRGTQLVVEWKEGITDSAAARLQVPIGEGLLGRLVASGDTFSYSHLQGNEPFRPFWPLGGMEQMIPSLRTTGQGFSPREDLKNFLVVGLRTPLDQAPFGLLLIGNRLVGDSYNASDTGYVQILATDAAISIRNLFFLAELERSHQEMIQALAQAIEAKDPYTSGHVARVRSYSMRLARAMGTPAKFVQDVDTAAMLHDVGKISTPDSVLMKEGPLDDAEFAIMKQHVVHSVRIIRDIKSVSPEVQKMVLYHHERWDGRGYPEGIAGEAIPLGAQIISVADAYDAMTSDRPYRKGFTPEEAMKRLEAGAHSQFNAGVLSYFMAMFNYEPQNNAELRTLVGQAKQRVGANLMRSSDTAKTSRAADSSSLPVVAVSEASQAGPARRGPDRLDLDA